MAEAMVETQAMGEAMEETVAMEAIAEEDMEAMALRRRKRSLKMIPITTETQWVTLEITHTASPPLINTKIAKMRNLSLEEAMKLVEMMKRNHRFR